MSKHFPHSIKGLLTAIKYNRYQGNAGAEESFKYYWRLFYLQDAYSTLNRLRLGHWHQANVPFTQIDFGDLRIHSLLLYVIASTELEYKRLSRFVLVLPFTHQHYIFLWTISSTPSTLSHSLSTSTVCYSTFWNLLHIHPLCLHPSSSLTIVGYHPESRLRPSHNQTSYPFVYISASSVL
jgi:hypothetical protein